MSDESNIRPLTRAEQLEWLIPFLKEQIKGLQLDLLAAESEYLEIKQAEMQQTQQNSEKVKKL